MWLSSQPAFQIIAFGFDVIESQTSSVGMVQAFYSRQLGERVARWRANLELYIHD
jgi:hypothetical protein